MRRVTSLLRHIRSTEDGDFSQERCVQAYGSELADQLGNLVHRTLSMIGQYCGGIIPAPVGIAKKQRNSDRLPSRRLELSKLIWKDSRFTTR